jgi:hypothetical protein
VPVIASPGTSPPTTANALNGSGFSVVFARERRNWERPPHEQAADSLRIGSRSFRRSFLHTGQGWELPISFARSDSTVWVLVGGTKTTVAESERQAVLLNRFITPGGRHDRVF